MTDTLARLEALHAAATSGWRYDEWPAASSAIYRAAPALFAVVRAAQDVHASWYGGCLDTDYDRIASAFDGLTAALDALGASDD